MKNSYQETVDRICDKIMSDVADYISYQTDLSLIRYNPYDGMPYIPDETYEAIQDLLCDVADQLTDL